MEERKINEKESLALITEMISRTKDRYMLGDGNILLMWGYLTIAVGVLVWVLLTVTHNYAWNWLWFLIMIVGGIASPIMAKKQKVHKGRKSYSDKLTSSIWAVVMLSAIVSSLMCVGFYLLSGINTWSVMFAVALVFVPFTEIGQGIIINEKSFIWAGAIGLSAGIFTLCCIAGDIPLNASWFMPLFILAFVCMMIIPGHFINHKAKINQ